MTQDHPIDADVFQHAGANLASERTLLSLETVLGGHVNAARGFFLGVFQIQGWDADQDLCENNTDMSQDRGGFYIILQGEGVRMKT